MEMTLQERALLIVRDEGIHVGECTVLDRATNQDGRPKLGNTTVARAIVNPPPGMHVRHLCGNRCCVQPGHLVAGTLSDNQRDRWDRHGEVTKLTQDDIVAILRRLRDGDVQADVAHDFGVSQARVWRISKEWTL